MMFAGAGIQPTVEGLNQLEVSVLIKKYVAILGLINFGTQEDKAKARQALHQLAPIINKHVNAAAFETAIGNLDITEEEMTFIEKVVL